MSARGLLNFRSAARRRSRVSLSHFGMARAAGFTALPLGCSAVRSSVVLTVPLLRAVPTADHVQFVLLGHHDPVIAGRGPPQFGRPPHPIDGLGRLHAAQSRQDAILGSGRGKATRSEHDSPDAREVWACYPEDRASKL